MKTKYFVQYRDRQLGWVDTGETDLTLKQAERIAREVRAECQVATRVLPVGADVPPCYAKEVEQ